MIRRTWAEIDLDAAAHNMREIRRITKADARIMAVVKADAYGNGYEEMAKVFVENGADYLAVAMLEEGMQLRESGFTVPIMVLGTCSDDMLEGLVDYDITATIYSYETAKKLSDIARDKNKTAKIHIKLDTGMGRIGLVVGEENDEIVDEIEEISKLSNIMIEGIFSHFSTSDEEDSTYTNLQFYRFKSVCNSLKERGIEIPIRHICNSAGIMMYPHMHLDMVRPGVILYGMYPSSEVDRERIDLKPVMTLKSRITYIKEVGPKRGISYGKEYITKTPKTVIATVPVGYADGYLRGIARDGRVEVNGEIAPIVGRICMDQCMIDVTNVHNINVGDEVTLFGSNIVTIDDIAKTLGTINYEVSCCISKRIPRVYIKNGEEKKVVSYLL